MITWYELDDLEKARVSVRAEAWYKEHKSHVNQLIEESSGSYSPSGSDLYRPELWKSAHWRWFKQATGL